MRNLHKSPAKFDNFIIRSCTYNGIWEVEERDPQTGIPVLTYDFVNKEYYTADMAMQFPQPTYDLETLPPDGVFRPHAISMDMMSEPERLQFLTLQKKLNQALLDEGKNLF